MKTKVSKTVARKYANKYHIDLDIVPLEYFHKGMNVELEHGSRFGAMYNVTHNDLDITSKIVIAHLLESPDYYQRLEKLEERADKYWKNKNKNIFTIIHNI